MKKRVWVAKNTPRTTAAELQKIVESKGQKTSKKISNCSYITTYCLGGFQEKLSKLIQKQTIKYHNSIKYQQIKKQYKWLTLLEIL